MHNDLLSVRYEYGYPIVLGILLQRSFSLLNLSFNLFKTAKINLVQYLFMDLFEILFFESYLVRNCLNFFFEAIDLFFVNWDM